MDFQLDIGTLLYLFIFGNLFTGLLITFYRFHSPKDMASALFIGSKWVQVLFGAPCCYGIICRIS